MNIILQELANIVIHVSQSEDVSPECHLWWDASHDVHSPLSEINYSFGQDSCSGVSLSETIFSDCFSPPATQSQHNAELQCHSAELLHDVPECYPELSNMAPALPGVYSLLPTDSRLYEDEEKVTAMPDVRVTTETAALQSCGPASTDTLSVSLSTSTDAVSSSEDSNSSSQPGADFNIITNLLSRMQRVAPADRFSPSLSRKKMKKRRRKFERKELHPDLITMWRMAQCQ